MVAASAAVKFKTYVAGYRHRRVLVHPGLSN